MSAVVFHLNIGVMLAIVLFNGSVKLNAVGAVVSIVKLTVVFDEFANPSETLAFIK